MAKMSNYGVWLCLNMSDKKIPQKQMIKNLMFPIKKPWTEVTAGAMALQSLQTPRGWK